MQPVPPPSPTARLPLRVTTLLVSAGWVGAAACWISALFLPWTRQGLLSSSTLLDAVRLVRRGVVDSVIPASAGWLLLVPTLVAIALLAASGFRGRVLVVLQCVLALLGTVASVGIAWKLVEGDLGRAGLGVWISLLGVLVAIAATVVAILDGRAARRTSSAVALPPPPTGWGG